MRFDKNSQYYVATNYKLEMNIPIQMGETLSSLAADTVAENNVRWVEDTRIPLAICIATRKIPVRTILTNYMEAVLFVMRDYPSFRAMINMGLVPLVFLPSDLYDLGKDIEIKLSQTKLNIVAEPIVVAGKRMPDIEHRDLWVSRIDLAAVLNMKPEDVRARHGLDFLFEKVGVENDEYYK